MGWLVWLAVWLEKGDERGGWGGMGGDGPGIVGGAAGWWRGRGRGGEIRVVFVGRGQGVRERGEKRGDKEGGWRERVRQWCYGVGF